MTLNLDEHDRAEPPLDGNEWETLTGFLDYQRATLAWKSADLTPAQLAQRLPPSSMTIAGLMKHLAHVEDNWFGRWLHNEPRREPWASVDWAAEPEWEWESARSDDPDAVRTLWQESVARARTPPTKHSRGAALAARRTGPGQTAEHPAFAG